MKAVLLISGKAGHGKDTFAEMLQQELEKRDKKVITLHFADLVKFYAEKYFFWNGEKDINGRALLQKIGNDTFRGKAPNYWAYITAVCAQVLLECFNYDYVLIPDNRYPNEIDTVKEYNNNVVTIRIERYDENDRLWNNPNLTDEQKQNEGEIALDNYVFDYLIYNHSLEEMYESAEELIKELTKSKN